MVRRCQYKDEHGCRCKRQPRYGKESGKPTVCGLHNDQDWENAVDPRCRHPDCNTFATCGPEGTKKRWYCVLHGREMGMEDAMHPTCKCEKCRPTFGKRGEGATHCKDCKEDGMVDVVSPTCEVDGCTKQPSFGFEGGPATHCGPHGRERGMKNVVSKQCAVDGCETIPNFGFKGGPATHCGPHALKGMRDVKSKRCVSCGFFIVKIKPYLCSDCNPSKRKKTREMTVKKLLESATDLEAPIHDKIIEGGCYKYRPDFLYDAATHRVVVEVDEDQHDSYNPECEKVRMINIVEALGMRCVFIRYNPDTFKIDGKTFRVSEKKRHELLLNTIREYMKPSFDSETADVVYLYYDGAEMRMEML